MPKDYDINVRVIGKKGTEQEGQVIREFSGTYAYGETCEESIKMFGPDVVNSKFIAADIITLQGKLRSNAEKGAEDGQLNEILKSHKPGVATARVAIAPEVALANKINLCCNLIIVFPVSLLNPLDLASQFSIFLV